MKAGVILILAAAVAAPAAGEPICADRPGKANATCTAPTGHLQVETALADWTLDRAQGERDTALALGVTAIKFGLSHASHVEVDVAPYVRANRHRGFGDVVARYKQRITASAAPVQIALYPFVKLPTARRPLGNHKLEAGLALPVGYALAHSPFSLTFGPELDWAADGDGAGHHLAMVQAASIGAQLSPRLSISGELWGAWDWDRSGTTRQVSADAAIAYLATSDLQLDAGANAGLNRNTPDLELYAGIARRF